MWCNPGTCQKGLGLGFRVKKWGPLQKSRCNEDPFFGSSSGRHLIRRMPISATVIFSLEEDQFFDP